MLSIAAYWVISGHFGDIRAISALHSKADIDCPILASPRYHLQIVVVLLIGPALRRRAEGLAQATGGVSGNAHVLGYKSLNARSRQVHLAGAPADKLSGTRNASRSTSPGCLGGSFFRHRFWALVVFVLVSNSRLFQLLSRLPGPIETNPLILNSWLDRSCSPRPRTEIPVSRLRQRP